MKRKMGYIPKSEQMNVEKPFVVLTSENRTRWIVWDAGTPYFKSLAITGETRRRYFTSEGEVNKSNEFKNML